MIMMHPSVTLVDSVKKTEHLSPMEIRKSPVESLFIPLIAQNNPSACGFPKNRVKETQPHKNAFRRVKSPSTGIHGSS
jgi:hypothetical protein